MFPFDPLAPELVRMRDQHRLQEAAHARLLRAFQSRTRRTSAVSWSILSLAALLGLMVGLGTVDAGEVDRAGVGRNDRPVDLLALEPPHGAVVAADAVATGMSVAAVVQARGSNPVPGPGAPGQAGTSPVHEGS